MRDQPPARGVTPGRKLAFTLATVLVAAAAAGLVAMGFGWLPVAPPDLPVAAYAPRVGNATDYDTTLDHGTFEARGSRYEAELVGPSVATGGAYYEVRIVRTGGDGGRIVLSSLTVLDEKNATLGQAEGACHRDGAACLLADVALTPGNRTLRAEAIVGVYRESWIGAWRADPIVLVFTAHVEAR